MGGEATETYVCPKCGTPTQGHSHCPGCGRPLALRRLITRSEWEERQEERQRRQLDKADRRRDAEERIEDIRGRKPSDEAIEALIEMAQDQGVKTKKLRDAAIDLLWETEDDEPRLIAQYQRGFILATDERLVVSRGAVMTSGSWTHSWPEIAEIKTTRGFSLRGRDLRVQLHQGGLRGIRTFEGVRPSNQARAIADFGHQQLGL